MGTSVNQSSPRTLNWSVAQSAYRDPAVQVARVAAEVWRAALNQPAGNLADLLAQPIVARIGDLASESRSSVDLARKSAFIVAESKQSSLAADIARRAAMQAITSSDRMKTYTERLFSEATSYLVSRDLPGYVGIGRARNVVESMEFKAQVVRYVAEVASGIPRPTEMNAKTWAGHVRSVVDHLRGTGR